MPELEELISFFSSSKEEPLQIAYAPSSVNESAPGDNGESLPDPLFLDKFDALDIPSLYDFLVNQEKLAAEIRRQNRELRSLSHATIETKELLGHINQRLDEMEMLSTEEAEEPLTPAPLDESGRVLMNALDALWHLLQSSRETAKTILSITPKKWGFWNRSQPSWRLHLKEVLAGHAEGIKVLEEKITSSLSDLGIVRILPKIGSPFDPSRHKVIETVSERKAEKVAKVIQCGYVKNGEILRYAEVTIY